MGIVQSVPHLPTDGFDILTELFVVLFVDFCCRDLLK
jgi:hypothetical protein